MASPHAGLVVVIAAFLSLHPTAVEILGRDASSTQALHAASTASSTAAASTTASSTSSASASARDGGAISLVFGNLVAAQTHIKAQESQLASLTARVAALPATKNATAALKGGRPHAVCADPALKAQLSFPCDDFDNCAVECDSNFEMKRRIKQENVSSYGGSGGGASGTPPSLLLLQMQLSSAVRTFSASYSSSLAAASHAAASASHTTSHGRFGNIVSAQKKIKELGTQINRLDARIAAAGKGGGAPAKNTPRAICGEAGNKAALAFVCVDFENCAQSCDETFDMKRRIKLDKYALPSDGVADATSGASCQEIKHFHPGSAGTGKYFLKGPANKTFEGWCDMSTEGGGYVKNFLQHIVHRTTHELERLGELLASTNCIMLHDV